MNFRETATSIILPLTGRIDLDQASAIEAELNAIIQTHPGKHLILNLEDVEYMSSSGLRVFVSIMRNLKGFNRSLRLCALSAAVQRIMEIMTLPDMFDIYDSEEEALAAG